MVQSVTMSTTLDVKDACEGVAAKLVAGSGSGGSAVASVGKMLFRACLHVSWRVAERRLAQPAHADCATLSLATRI